MDFIPDFQAWIKWNDENANYPDDPFPAPQEYPCFVYLVARSWGYEEEDAIYLYRKDIASMYERVMSTQDEPPGETISEGDTRYFAP